MKKYQYNLGDLINYHGVFYIVVPVGFARISASDFDLLNSIKNIPCRLAKHDTM